MRPPPRIDKPRNCGRKSAQLTLHSMTRTCVKFASCVACFLLCPIVSRKKKQQKKHTCNTCTTRHGQMGTGFLRRLLSTTPGLTHQSLHTAKAKGYVYVLPAEWRMGSELSARRSLPYQPTHTPHHTTHRVQNYRRPAKYTTLD